LFLRQSPWLTEIYCIIRDVDCISSIRLRGGVHPVKLPRRA